MIIVDIKQGSEEWIKEKLGKPSASNISKILTNAGKPSKQREGYLYELVAERLTGRREESYKNANMEMGNEREEESRSMFELLQDASIEQVGVVYKDEKKEFLCSPDGIVPKQKYGLELKNVLPKTQVKYLLNGKLPSEYFGQCQSSLYVTGFDYWMFMSFCPGLKPLIIMVEPDKEYINALKVELEIFTEELNKITDKLRGE